MEERSPHDRLVATKAAGFSQDFYDSDTAEGRIRIAKREAAAASAEELQASAKWERAAYCWYSFAQALIARFGAGDVEVTPRRFYEKASASDILELPPLDARKP